jgi:EAL domain-containing protein (putative c-di-GMP-specific phosphodiesterase class I)
VKIGAAYVGDMRQVTFHAKIVRSLAHLAQDLGFRVTAEGVDDEETALALSTIGCERVQGGYVGRALTAQEILACKFDGADPVRLPFGPAG